jgi:2-keto-4-pentenoate hydratase/2-oxohepta-3-ene-1,7-dioic acid hydratase in catechol pathway
MRFFSHQVDGSTHVGGYRKGVPVDLGPGDLGEFVRRQAFGALDKARKEAPELAVEDVRYLPVIPNPPKIVCVGLNYREHRDEAGARKTPEFPDFFLRVATTLVGHRGIIERPANSTALDFEGELALIIGRPARSVAAARALGVVAGYSVFNDASLRDYQFRTTQWTLGKNHDDTGAFGPDLVTPDELPRSVKEGLGLETRLNGASMQSASTADLIFDIPALIEMLSEVMTLQPGDIVVTGTPGGVGFARTPKVYMTDGDVVEVEIEGVGCLRNVVKDATPVPRV